MDNENLPFEPREQNLQAKFDAMQLSMNGASVYRYKDTIFVPLPRQLWRSCGPCACEDCRGQEGFWDTLAIPAKPSLRDYAWNVHCPPKAMARMMAQKRNGN